MSLSFSLLFFFLGGGTQEVIQKPDRDTNSNAEKHPSGLLPALCLTFLKSMSQVLKSLNNLQCSFACPGKPISVAELCWLHTFSDSWSQAVLFQICFGDSYVYCFWYPRKRKLFWKSLIKSTQGNAFYKY